MFLHVWLIVVMFLCFGLVKSKIMSMDLINSSATTITLKPGYSLTMTVDLTFFSSVSSLYAYGTDWKLLFYRVLLQAPVAAGPLLCSKSYASNSEIKLPAIFYMTDGTLNIFQEFKLRLYNYNSNPVIVLPQVWC